MKTVRQLLEQLETRGLRRELEPLCAKLGVTLEKVLGRDRPRSLSHARAVLCCTMQARYGLSASEVARLLGRDPSTVNVILKKWKPAPMLGPASTSSRVFALVVRSHHCSCGGCVQAVRLAADGKEFDSVSLRDLGMEEPLPGRLVKITATYVDTL